MNFTPTKDQLALAETARDYLMDVHGSDTLRRLDGASEPDPGLWRGFTEMGLTGVCVPDSFGGLGLGLVDAALVAIECGRACVADPLVDTAFVGAPWLLQRSDYDHFEALVRGDMKAALAHPVNPWIADLDQADVVLSGDGALDAKALRLEPLTSVDPLRRLFRAPMGIRADDSLLDLAALMAAAQLVGLADAMLAQATDYAKVRQQFGQPIGAFQAVKHQHATALTAIEFARPLIWNAAQALQSKSPRAAVAVSHAKIAAGDAAVLTGETAIQSHGAMGYTYEVDLHFWMKRSWALNGAWGDRAFHLRRLEAAILGATLPIGPEHTFA
jgi:alkylation response protein AidB-like acyl-CoA dehydrogenase